MSEYNYSLIFWTLSTGILSALATGLGALPVHFLTNRSNSIRAFASAVAAGMMISASVFSLVQEGIALQDQFPYASYGVIIGILLGSLFFWLTDRHVDESHISQHMFTRGFSKGSLLLFIAMFIHSIPEGIAIGVGFATGNFQFGLLIAIAISVHNIPEGIAISLPLKSEGISTPRCAIVSILSSAPQPVMAVPAALLASFFKPILPIALGFAGGAMIYIVLIELIPNSLKNGGKTLTAWGFMLGLTGMLLITTLLKAIGI